MTANISAAQPSAPQPGDILKDKTERNYQHHIRKFIGNRITVADDIAERYQGQNGILGDQDAQVILCAALGAMSSILWKSGKDYQKFTELLVRYANVSPSAKTISLPGLSKDLEVSRGSTDLSHVRSSSQVQDATEVDCLENDVKIQSLNLSLKEIRSNSYANLIYKNVRCGLLHEYQITDKVVGNQSYAGSKELHYYHLTRQRDMEGGRVLFMPYSYLRKLALSIVENVSAEWEAADTWSFEVTAPQRWWIDG